MKDKIRTREENLQRQFLLYVLLPLSLVVVGAIVAANIFLDDTDSPNGKPEFSSNEVQGTSDLTALLNVGGVESDAEAPIESEADFGISSGQGGDSGNESQDSEQNSNKDNSIPNGIPVFLVQNPTTVFYSGLIICGGLVVLILGAGVILFIQPGSRSGDQDKPLSEQKTDG